MTTLNYYVYTADSGARFAIRESVTVATFSGLFLVPTRLPRFPRTHTTRYYVLSDLFTSSERRVVADLPLIYSLGDLVFYNGAFYYVTRIQQQQGPTERP